VNQYRSRECTTEMRMTSATRHDPDSGYNANMRSTTLLDEIEREAIDGDISKALRVCPWEARPEAPSFETGRRMN